MFFFKQKTAYEMRISDWSSDVCSSALLKSNMQEVHARGGELYVFADADTKIVNSDGIHVIRMPEHSGKLSPILHTIPLQLLADRKSVVTGQSVSGRVDLGGRRIIKHRITKLQVILVTHDVDIPQ